ncbi:DUF3024 domain-containing protein [Psychromonas ossibalaenae]|uniref:DUF3024 domain-containing protein n=1 Tax=Psychromonas ossibalaenae TaxID=444922 RepID=UPI00036B4C65|nr:DUF3024 domain-containing protein [Psychromonas ossibalaenae]
MVYELIENRKEQAIKNGFDLGCKFNNQSTELFEIHPSTHNEQGFFNLSVAKLTFIRTKDIWKIFWMRGSLKWQGYGRSPEARKLNEALFVVNEDADGCFWKLSSAT